MADALSALDVLAERVAQPVVVWQGVMLVPHYILPHRWVAPGGKTFTTSYLRERHATCATYFLWSRRWTQRFDPW